MTMNSDKSLETRDAENAAIAAFWQWWAQEGKARATAVYDRAEDTSEEPGRLGEAIGEHLDLLGLAYEVSPGAGARHLLVFTPDGDPSLDDIADRWLAHAPAADEAFEYDNRRPAIADPGGVEVMFGEHRFDLLGAKVLAERGGGRVHLHVVHDAYREAPGEVVEQVTKIFVDAVLGERVVERQIGSITSGADHRDGEIPLAELPEVVGTV